MDTSKLTVKLPIDKFYNTYVETIRNLYTESFINQNHLEPSTCSSFQRAMSKRAGISLEKREDTKQYTKDDLIAIANDTNSKYEEYLSGDYSESTKARGMARYRLLSTVLKATFTQLGYKEVAEQFKYAEDSKAEAEANINKAYDDAIAVEKKEEEDLTVKKNTEILKNSLSSVKEKIEEFSKKELSEQDRKVLQKLNVTLKDTIDSAIKCTEGKSNVEELKELIKQGEGYVVQIQDMITGQGKQKLEQVVQAQQPITGNFEIDYAEIIKTLSITPGFLQALVDKNEQLAKANADLQSQLDDLKGKTTLPDGDDGLLQLMKDSINKIQDKNKLKDIVMLIALKVV